METGGPDSAKILVGFDVGGSNVRARIVVLRDGEIEARDGEPEPLSRAAGSKAEVAGFIGEVAERAGPDLAAAAVAFAGPVSGDQVRMTNWPEPRVIALRELVDWGLPEEATTMANDVEAGAHGLVRRLCREGPDAENLFHTLRYPGPAAGDGSMVLVMPGTGLGCAGIVRLPRGEGEDRFLPVPSEGGHLPAAALDDEHATMLARLRHERDDGAPSWEDCVSGEGLTTIYRFLAPSGDEEPDLMQREDPAAAIAEAARRGSDDRSRRALTLYYRCVGRFAQAMALAFRATGGVFIGGGSTRANREFIEASPLVDDFLANREQRPLLERIPLFLVLDRLNLPGALALAARRFREGR